MWGFTPMTHADFSFMAEELKTFLDPDLILFIELDGETVGYCLSLPDINQALLRAYPNPQTPEWLTMAKLAWHMKVRPNVTQLRLLMLGLLDHAKVTGLDALLYYDTAMTALTKGYFSGELSWVLETNIPVIQSACMMGAKRSKTWRIYERSLRSTIDDTR
jgi:hypothetical protein